eukprot:13367907-Ditylum_brightwellii.AAC.1
MARHLQGRVSNNMLEYLAEIITIWVDITEGRLETEDCILALSDSSSTISWTFKSNFHEEKQSTSAEAAKKLAALIIESDTCLYS